MKLTHIEINGIEYRIHDRPIQPGDIVISNDFAFVGKCEEFLGEYDFFIVFSFPDSLSDCTSVMPRNAYLPISNP